MDNKKFDVKELSEYLNISISMIRKLTSKKSIPHYRIGKKILFDANEIDVWLKSNHT